MEKFVEITRKDKGFDKENSWFMYCQKERIPFVTVKTRSKLALVQWDYITYPTELDEAIFSLSEEFKERMTAIYSKHQTKETSLGIGPGVISFWNLEIHAAREVASELFDVIHMALASPILENERRAK